MPPFAEIRGYRMTIIEAINQVDNIKPNEYSQADKVRWLSKLDGIVKVEIIDTHEGEPIEFNGYSESDMSVELLVKAPYDDVYVKYLESQIDYANNEYGKYNNTSYAFNTAYEEFARYYNRTHMPKGTKFKY